jgi:DNA-binding FadR family transcriptional regulator
LGQDVAGSFENGQTHHRNVLATVRSKDAAGARRAMLEHLNDSERIMRQALAARKSE